MRFLSPAACGEALVSAAQQQVLLREVRLRLLLLLLLDSYSTRLESSRTLTLTLLPLLSVLSSQLSLSFRLETNSRVVPIPVECSHAKWVHNPLQFSSAHSSRTFPSEPLSTRRRLLCLCLCLCSLCALLPLLKRTRNSHSPPFPFLIEFRFLTRRAALLCSACSNSDDNLLRNIELFEKLALWFRGRILFVKDILCKNEICCWAVRLFCFPVLPLHSCLAVYLPPTVPTSVRRAAPRPHSKFISLVFCNRSLVLAPPFSLLCLW